MNIVVYMMFIYFIVQLVFFLACYDRKILLLIQLLCRICIYLSQECDGVCKADCDCTERKSIINQIYFLNSLKRKSLFVMKFKKSIFAGVLASAGILMADVSAQTAPPTAQIPLEHFISREKVHTLRLSPDGQHLAFNQAGKDGDYIFRTITVVRTSDMQVVSRVRLPKFETPGDIRWVSNKRLVVAKATETYFGEAPLLTGEILAYDIDGGKQEYLFGYDMINASSRGKEIVADYGYGSIHSVPPSLDGNVYIRVNPWGSEKTTLYVINSNKATRKVVAEFNHSYLGFGLDKEGQPRIAYGESSSLNRVTFVREGAEWKEKEFKWWIYNPVLVDNQFYTLGDTEGEIPRLLKISPDLSKVDVIEENKDGIGNLHMLGRHGNYYAYQTKIGRPKTIFLQNIPSEVAEHPNVKLHKALVSQFPDESLSVVSESVDGGVWILHVASDQNPGSYYLFNTKSGKAELILQQKAELDVNKMAKRIPVRYMSRDGLAIDGYMTRHLPVDGKKQALIVLPHGGPHGIYDSWYFDEEAQLLASRGYAVLQINYRGSGSKGGKFIEAGYKNWGTNIVNDLVDGLNWAKNQPGIDGERICAYGGSFGAYASMMLEINQPGLLKCVAGYAGLYDLNTLFEKQGIPSDKYLSNYFKKAVGDDPEKLKKYSPLYNADKIRVPVFLAHGGNDERTTPGQAIRMHEALERSNPGHEWMFVETEGHGFYNVRHEREFYDRLLKFLDKHLKTAN